MSYEDDRAKYIDNRVGEREARRNTAYAQQLEMQRKLIETLKRENADLKLQLFHAKRQREEALRPLGARLRDLIIEKLGGIP